MTAFSDVRNVVGYVGDEFAFELPRGFERFVALGQRPFDPGHIGHVERGQHVTIRERHRRHLQHRAVAVVERAARRRMCGDLGDDLLLRRRPVCAIVEKDPHPVDDLTDMRPPCDIVLRQSPDF